MPTVITVMRAVPAWLASVFVCFCSLAFLNAGGPGEADAPSGETIAASLVIGWILLGISGILVIIAIYLMLRPPWWIRRAGAEELDLQQRICARVGWLVPQDSQEWLVDSLPGLRALWVRFPSRREFLDDVPWYLRKGDRPTGVSLDPS